MRKKKHAHVTIPHDVRVERGYKAVQFSLPLIVDKEITRLAEQSGLTRSMVVRRAISALASNLDWLTYADE